MLDIETIKIAVIVFVCAVIATVLRRRVGLIFTLWAIAIGLFIVVWTAKMEVARRAKQELMGSGLPQREFSPPLPQISPSVINQPTIDELVTDEEIDDELGDEPIEEGWSDE